MRVSCKFTEEEAVRAAFERLDDDGSGELDIDEIGQLMETIGRNLNEKQFFFKQKTAYEILRSDWSSDVCSSD
eukprot:COSAG01_NODE_44638_length_417_cov_0.619497_1_plen_72_part_10